MGVVVVVTGAVAGELALLLHVQRMEKKLCKLYFARGSKDLLAAEKQAINK